MFDITKEPDKNNFHGILLVKNIDDKDDEIVLRFDSPMHTGTSSPCQLMGATNTYIQKYLMMNLLMLEDSKEDPDRTMDRDVGGRTHKKPKPEEHGFLS